MSDASSSTLRISKVYDCPVCYIMYDRTTHLPKSLRCGHTTCLACVRQLVVRSTRLRCPSCRKEHYLEDTAEDLPTNFSLLEALDTMCVECHSQCAVETKSKKCQGCIQRFVNSSMETFQESVKSFKAKVTKLIVESKEEVDVKAINAEADKLCEDVPQVFAEYHRELDEREKKLKVEVRERAASHIENEHKMQLKKRDDLAVIEKKLEDFVSGIEMKQPGDIAATMKHVEDLQVLSNDIARLTDHTKWWHRLDNSIGNNIHECKDFINTITRTSSLYMHCGACTNEHVMSIGVSDLSSYGMWYGHATVAQVLENGLNEPQDVAVSPLDGSIVVANEGSRSLVFFTERVKTSDEKGDIHESMIPYEFEKVLTNLGKEETKLFGVTIAKNGQIFVTDQKLNCVWVIDRSKGLVKKIGTKGKGQLEFDYPTGITIDVDAGHLYICEFNNRRVQVITTDGRFVRSFGSDVLACVSDQGAWYIAVEKGKSGKVYLIDSDSELHIFNKTGKHLQSQYLLGHAEYGLALDAMGNLLTAGYHPNVLLRNTQFQVIVKIGSRGIHDKKYKFGEVRGIAVNKNGNLIVCDHKMNNLKVLVQELM